MRLSSARRVRSKVEACQAGAHVQDERGVHTAREGADTSDVRDRQAGSGRSRRIRVHQVLALNPTGPRSNLNLLVSGTPPGCSRPAWPPGQRFNEVVAAMLRCWGSQPMHRSDSSDCRWVRPINTVGSTHAEVAHRAGRCLGRRLQRWSRWWSLVRTCLASG